jgi:hypothetical protein
MQVNFAETGSPFTSHTAPLPLLPNTSNVRHSPLITSIGLLDTALRPLRAFPRCRRSVDEEPSEDERGSQGAREGAEDAQMGCVGLLDRIQRSGSALLSPHESPSRIEEEDGCQTALLSFAR